MGVCLQIAATLVQNYYICIDRILEIKMLLIIIQILCFLFKVLASNLSYRLKISIKISRPALRYREGINLQTS